MVGLYVLAVYTGRTFGWLKPDRRRRLESRDPSRTDRVICWVLCALTIAFVCAAFFIPAFQQADADWMTRLGQNIPRWFIELAAFVGIPVWTAAAYVERRTWLQGVWAALAIAVGWIALKVRGML